MSYNWKISILDYEKLQKLKKNITSLRNYYVSLEEIARDFNSSVSNIYAIANGNNKRYKNVLKIERIGAPPKKKGSCYLREGKCSNCGCEIRLYCGGY